MEKNNRKIVVGLILFISLILLSGCTKPTTTVGPVIKQKLANGVYDGSYLLFPNRAVVKVTIKDNIIVKIQLISHLAWRGRKAELPIIKEIKEQQSTKVDAVSGATNSSEAIMKAVQNAIDKAEINNN